jgi:hypothetical protein
MSDAQEIFNPTGSDLTLSSYAIGHVTNGGDGTNYETWCASISCQSHLLLCSIGIFLSRPSSPDVVAVVVVAAVVVTKVVGATRSASARRRRWLEPWSLAPTR